MCECVCVRERAQDLQTQIQVTWYKEKWKKWKGENCRSTGNRSPQTCDLFLIVFSGFFSEKTINPSHDFRRLTVLPIEWDKRDICTWERKGECLENENVFDKMWMSMWKYYFNKMVSNSRFRFSTIFAALIVAGTPVQSLNVKGRYPQRVTRTNPLYIHILPSLPLPLLSPLSLFIYSSSRKQNSHGTVIQHQGGPYSDEDIWGSYLLLSEKGQMEHA